MVPTFELRALVRKGSRNPDSGLFLTRLEKSARSRAIFECARLHSAAHPQSPTLLAQVRSRAVSLDGPTVGLALAKALWGRPRAAGGCPPPLPGWAIRPRDASATNECPWPTLSSG